MDLDLFVLKTAKARVFLVGELHRRPEDIDAVLFWLMYLAVKRKRRIHFFVEYFDSYQNEVIQPYMKCTEFHDKELLDDEHAGTSLQHIQYLITKKNWPGKYFGGGGSKTFEESWMHSVEIPKIIQILAFANANNIPVKGFDLPLDRGADGSEFPSKRGSTKFAAWNQGRDTWMASHIMSFLNAKENDGWDLVCFVGAAHCWGIKYGDRRVDSSSLKPTFGLNQRTQQPIVVLTPKFDTMTGSIEHFISGGDNHDYELHVTALSFYTQPSSSTAKVLRLRGG